MDNTKKMYFEMIFNKFGTMRLNKKQMGEICNQSESTLDRIRRDRMGCEFSKESGMIFYPLDKVVEHLLKTKKTA
ncbi:hypothetical protein [uncultured Desulfobacter sp.]|uniref:hypothetical protein n=1 Tax=uncultured Desulfobacter sp. TaxID=240139 RepID=UPI0029C81820|nr:hypothetical protein [uncultured Desulfobacter sp.]